MDTTNLDTQKLTDMHNDCVLIQATTNELQEQMRVILPDLFKKADTDNIGTTSNKRQPLNTLLDELPSLSTVTLVAENLIEVANNLLKK